MNDGKKITWVVPGVTVGSGGMRTIVNAVNELVSRGHICTVLQHCEPFEGAQDPRAVLIQSYGLDRSVDVQSSSAYSDIPDCMVATWWATAYYVQQSHAKTKAYFIQDYEPEFFASSEYFLAARKTYTFGFNHIAIGRGLANRLQKDFNAPAAFFDFGVDFDVYRPLGFKRERAICALFQPGKPHRCASLLETTLKILHAQDPSVAIYLYGSNDSCPLPFVEHLGLLNISQCNELYNKCSVGLCLSASNPSRIPFEMFASGLPVVDLYGENTVYDYRDGSISLSDCTPQALADCLISLLDDPKKREAQSKNGLSFIKGRSSQKEVSDIANLLETAMSETASANTPFEKIYPGPPPSVHETPKEQYNFYGMFRDRDYLKANAIEIQYRTEQPFNEHESLNIAMWSASDQSDLIWFPCEQDNSMSAKCIICGSSFHDKPGEYNIHMYSNIDGRDTIIAQVRLFLEPASTESTSHPQGYVHSECAGCTGPSFQIRIIPHEKVTPNNTTEKQNQNKQGRSSIFHKLFNR